jgi:hypothetical protein
LRIFPDEKLLENCEKDPNSEQKEAVLASGFIIALRRNADLLHASWFWPGRADGIQVQYNSLCHNPSIRNPSHALQSRDKHMRQYHDIHPGRAVAERFLREKHVPGSGVFPGRAVDPGNVAIFLKTGKF